MEGFIYKGPEPKLVEPVVDAKQVLKILEMQLEVLKMLSATKVFIPAGANIRKEDLG